MTLQLHEYQHQIARFIVNRLNTSIGAGIFADLGTGKTAATLTALGAMFDCGMIRNCLVLAPLRVVYNTWPAEIEKWTPDLDYAIIHGGKKNLYKRARIELQTHDSIHQLINFPGRWDCVVVDESRNFHNWSTRRMKSLRKMLPSIAKRIILTGTPTPESFADLHAQAYILDNGEALGKNVTVFRAQFMDRGGWMGRQWKMRKNLEPEVMARIDPMLIRVSAADHLDMPDLIENDVWVTMPADVRAQYNELKRELFLKLDAGELLIGHAAALYTKLKQLCGGRVYFIDEDGERKSQEIHEYKIDALKEILYGLYEKPAIILYQFKNDRDRILSLVGKGARVIDGETSDADTIKIIKDWNRGKIKYLVSHPKCLGHGLNLQHGGSDMVWFGLTDSCDQYLQTRGRLWRQGQAQSVRVHRILMKGTVEELQLARVSGKIENQEHFLEALKNHAR